MRSCARAGRMSATGRTLVPAGTRWYRSGMDTLSSSEFRKTFARLLSPTLVQINGHTIGTWLPGESIPASVAAPPLRQLGRGHRGRDRPPPKPRPDGVAVDLYQGWREEAGEGLPELGTRQSVHA